MYPVIFDIGPFSLHTYGLAMAVAFGLGIWIAMNRAPQRGLDSKFVLDLSVIVLICGLIGGRVTYVLTHLDEFSGRWLDTISPIQSDGRIGIAGLVLLGGVIGGFLAAYITARIKKVEFLTVWDVLIPSLALGIAFGRIGCFFNGCCFGTPTALPWGCTFPDDSLAGSVFPHRHIHPTQLYETLAMFGLFAWLLFYDRKPRITGMLTAQFLILYGVWRFFVEGLRWYEEGMILTQISDFQFTLSRLISIGMMLAGAFLILRVRGAKAAVS